MRRLLQGELLSTLVDEGHLPEDAVTEAQILLRNSLSDADQPWFLKLLQGVGGWFASLVLMFGILAVIYSEHLGLTIFGSIVLGVGVKLNRTDSQSVFLSQVSLSCLLSGLSMLLIGVGSMFDSASLSALVGVGLCSIITYLTRAWVVRWMMSLATIASLAALVLLQESEIVWWALLISVGGSIVKLMICEETTRRTLGDYYGPVLAALSWALVSMCVIDLTKRDISFSEEIWIDSLPTVGFTLLMLIVLRHVIKDLGWSAGERSAIAVYTLAVAVCACLYFAPGAVASILLMTLAIRAQDRVLLGLSIAGLLGFGGHFYYEMEYSLLSKSMMLVSAGGLLVFAGAKVTRGEES